MTPTRSGDRRPRVGLALGGGAARGWGHIGVLRELERLGVPIDVVCGTSAGALVGAIYLCGGLDWFERWLRGLSRREILRYLDVSLPTGGGLLEGKRLMDFLRENLGDPEIGNLGRPFAAVVTDLGTGHELWLRDGPVFGAVRASMAVPGLFTPVALDGRWLVDGGLVNPVPVSACRALGAEAVIAVHLNGDRGGRRSGAGALSRRRSPEDDEETFLERLVIEARARASHLASVLLGGADAPGLLDVVTGAVTIMQERITRSRMGGDPPDVLLEPRLGGIGPLEFDRAQEAIEEGRRCTEAAGAAIRELAGLGEARG
ncbi:MAG: patatin-like phospholipase family protein [Deferrisomatales bacterium]|nr:patatin-like phospholipase family protein [Deferrisomatales bacterium]